MCLLLPPSTCTCTCTCMLLKWLAKMACSMLEYLPITCCPISPSLPPLPPLSVTHRPIKPFWVTFYLCTRLAEYKWVMSESDDWFVYMQLFFLICHLKSEGMRGRWGRKRWRGWRAKKKKKKKEGERVQLSERRRDRVGEEEGGDGVFFLLRCVLSIFSILSPPLPFLNLSFSLLSPPLLPLCHTQAYQVFWVTSYHYTKLPEYRYVTLACYLYTCILCVWATCIFVQYVYMYM